jgi:hypothetical protein
MFGEGGDHRPKSRAEGLVAEWVDEDLVVYDELSQMAHSLSADAALVWEHSEGRTSVAELANQLQMQEETVERAVRELREAELLEGSVTKDWYSRREAAMRLARFGSAAVAAPLVYSVAIGSAAAAGSCKNNGTVVASCSGASVGNKGTNTTCCSGCCQTTNGTTFTCVCCDKNQPCTQGSQCCSGACNTSSGKCSS